MDARLLDLLQNPPDPTGVEPSLRPGLALLVEAYHQLPATKKNEVRKARRAFVLGKLPAKFRGLVSASMEVTE